MTSTRAIALAAAVVVAASCVGAGDALAGHDPSSFQTRPSKTDLVFQYTMGQDECIAGTITDDLAVSGAVSTTTKLGSLTRTAGWDSVEKCAQATQSGSDFENAFNGVRSQGWRFETSGAASVNLTRSDAMTSAQDMTDAKQFLVDNAGRTFTLEFWLYTEAGITGDDKYVVMEIGEDDGSVPALGSSYNWACGTLENYDLQVVYQGTDNRFEVDYRFGSGTSDCNTIEFSSSPLAANTLYHVAISFGGLGGAGTGIAALYLDGVDIGNPLQAESGDRVDFTAWADTNVLRLGSSPATLSSSIAGGIPDFHSFPGTIVHASMYATAFHTSGFDGVEFFTATSTGDALTAFNARTRNSAPAGAAGTVTLDPTDEDLFGAVDLDRLMFDLDVAAFGVDSLTYSLVSGVTGATVVGGEFEADSSPVTTFPQSFTSTLTYRNSNPDTYGTDPSATFVVSATDDRTAAAVSSATATVVVTPQNDAPDAVTKATVDTAQADATLLVFAAEDRDCDPALAVGGDVSASCTAADGAIQNIQIVDLNITLGKLYKPAFTAPSTYVCDVFVDGVSEEVTTNEQFSSANNEWQADDAAGTASISLCFEACLSFNNSGTLSDNPCPDGVDGAGTAILGTDEIEFQAQNQAGSYGSIGTVSTRVTNVLQVTSENRVRIYEEQEAELTISGEDNLCVRQPGNALCPRAASFVVTSVPAPEVGAFYMENGTEPLVVGDEIPSTSGTAQAAADVVFVAAENFANLEPFPLCSPNPSTPAQPNSNFGFSTCPRITDGPADYPCTGPFCTTITARNAMPLAFNDDTPQSSYTTSNLLSQSIGACGNADREIGCPAQLGVSLKVSELLSEPASAVDVYVTGVNDAPTFAGSPTNVSDWRTSINYVVGVNDSFVQITDPDFDTRTVDVVISSSGTVSFPNLTQSSSLRFSVNGESVIQGGFLIGLSGPVSVVNAALRELNYVSAASLRSDEIVFTVVDESRLTQASAPTFFLDNFQSGSLPFNASFHNEEFTFDIEFDRDTTIEEFQLEAIVLWSAIIGASLLCLGCCYGVGSFVIRRAIAGERAALWLARNVLCTHVQVRKEDEDLGPEAARLSMAAEKYIHAEHETMRHVYCCVHCISCVCPCFKSLHVELPSEEAMLAATIKDIRDDLAQNHVPQGASPKVQLTEREALEYEQHEQINEQTGEVRKFLWNPHTNRSIWLASVEIIHDEDADY